MNFDEFLQPAIFALTGKPGAGKSYFATRCIIAEITKGRNRTIITNVPINRKKLREYTKKDFNVYDLETFTDNRLFFTNRGHYHLEIENTEANINFKDLLRDDDDGILYIIDEAHLYFNSRNWKHMSQATLCYITFIRHVGDSLIWMCQKYSDIDSQFRGKTQAFHVLRNLSKEKLGIFKRGSGFRCYQYQNEYEISAHGSNNNQASRDFKFPFKLPIAECYSTSLFNKSHEKTYKVRGVSISVLFWIAGLLIIAVVCFFYFGGATYFLKQAVPNIKQTELSKTTQKLAPQVPGYFDANLTKPKNFFESPNLIFQETKDKKTSRSTSLTKSEYENKLKFWFGESVQAKITFFAEGNQKDKDKGFNFSYQWSRFMSFQQGSLSVEEGLFNLSTPVFRSFIKWIDTNGVSSNLKETEILLKENVPFTLKHGYQLPSNRTFTTQGVIQQQRDYQQIGFQLELILQVIDGKHLLKLVVENSDVMDLSSDAPILQTFSATNVIDAEIGRTYLIADFNSQSSQKSKGFLRSNDYESNLNNKIFITYGTN